MAGHCGALALRSCSADFTASTGFASRRSRAYFANNKPPPAQISAVEAKTETVPRFATGIGSVAAVHQVTINPEVGGRVDQDLFRAGAAVKAGDPLVQLNDAPDRGDLASYQAQARWAETTLQRSSELAKRAVHGARDRRSEAEPARPGQGTDHQDRRR